MKKNNNNMIYQLNPLITAAKNFDVMETRLFYLGLKDVNPHVSDKDIYFDDKFPDTFISTNELIKIFGHGQYLKEIDNAANRLISRYISIDFEGGFEKYTIFQYIKYKAGKGLYLKFNEDMRPFILDIYKGYKKYGFTKIEMQQIFYLNSAYAMRLIELLLQYRNTKEARKTGIIKKFFTLEEIRNRLNVSDDKYPTMCNFRSAVLDKAIKSIHKKTNYIISYTTVKEMRKVIGFSFICNCQNVLKDDEFVNEIDAKDESVKEIDSNKLESKTDKEKKALPASSSQYEEQNSEIKSLIDKLKAYGMSSDGIEYLIENYSAERIDSNIKYAEKNHANKDNMAGFIRSCIKENHASNALENKSINHEKTDDNAKKSLWGGYM